jgi:hypothetical protein
MPRYIERLNEREAEAIDKLCDRRTTGHQFVPFDNNLQPVPVGIPGEIVVDKCKQSLQMQAKLQDNGIRKLHIHTRGATYLRTRP